MTGANNVIPTVPAFTSGAPSVNQLNQLSYAVSFLTNQAVRPAWHVYKKLTNSLTANAWHLPSYGNTAFDCDDVTGPGGGVCTIVTQGFYATECCFQFEGTATTNILMGCGFQIVAGSSNPHSSSGTETWYGIRADTQGTVLNTDWAMTCSDITPFCLYPGDTVSGIAISSSSGTLDYLQNTNYIEGRYAYNFTGWLVNTGT